ncbi:MAG: alpha-ketoacid dehydrogenase subunit beta [Atribacterota bacterium]|nr:alpha-ketoacid dehydrogenase subunit beta [Atribacterota bacterium]
MRKISFAQATVEALEEEMIRDERVFVLGEDVSSQGGYFGQYKGLPEKFGYERVKDTPISETAIVGAAIGAAIVGMRPIVELNFADFMGICMDEIFNQMAKIRYMFGGQAKVPLVLRAPNGITSQAAAHHSQSLEAWFLHIPGLKVVIPSNPADAKGLLKSAIRDENPVIFFENKNLFRLIGEVPNEEFLIPIGKAKVVRKGVDVTIVTYSSMLHKSLQAAEILAKEGINTEIIDLRTVLPYDKETILKSLKSTHRLVVIHEAVKIGGVGAEIAAMVAEEAFSYLNAPILRIGAPFTPIPFSPPLEKIYTINAEKIADRIRMDMFK